MNFLNNLFKSNSQFKTGFDFNYLSDNYVYIRNRPYTTSNINRLLEILKDSSTLINTTKNPKVFFERYLLCISILNELIPIEHKIKFIGDTPSKIKKQLQLKENYTVNDFIDRYYQDFLEKISSLKTRKAKINKINKFKEDIEYYELYIQDENIKKYNNLYTELLKQIN